MWLVISHKTHHKLLTLSQRSSWLPLLATSRSGLQSVQCWHQFSVLSLPFVPPPKVFSLLKSLCLWCKFVTSENILIFNTLFRHRLLCFLLQRWAFSIFYWVVTLCTLTPVMLRYWVSWHYILSDTYGILTASLKETSQFDALKSVHIPRVNSQHLDTNIINI